MILFLPIAILFGAITNDWWDSLFVISLFGGVVGFLVGGGSTFVDWFSDPEFVNPEKNGSLSGLVVGSYLDGVIPSWLSAIFMFHKVATKDYSRARPGRLKRAMIGACFGAVMGFLFWFIMLGVPSPSPPIVNLLLFTTIGAVTCGLGGALTDAIEPRPRVSG